MKIIDESRFQLESGRTFYAFRNIIGLVDNDDYYELSYGFDDYLCRVDQEYEDNDEDDDFMCGKAAFTTDEKLDIADYMINKWLEYKDGLIKSK